MKHYTLKGEPYEAWIVTYRNIRDVGKWLLDLGWVVGFVSHAGDEHLVFKKHDVSDPIAFRTVHAGEVIASDLNGYVGVWPKKTFLVNFKEVREE